MEQMVNYIFSSLSRNERAIKNVHKVINKQKRLNKTVSNLAFIMTIYIIIDGWYEKTQDHRIDALEKEIMELKRVKGD